MTSRIAKLYNVLVIGGAMAASAGCTKADKDKPQDPPAEAKAKATDQAPAPTPQTPPAPSTQANDQPTPTEKAEPTAQATTDPAAPATDDKKKTAHEQQIDQRIEISCHRLSADTEPRRQTGGVQHLALAVRQHLPEPAHGFRRKARTKRRQITLQVSLDE